jgi:hypothetical protein
VSGCNQFSGFISSAVPATGHRGAGLCGLRRQIEPNVTV